MLITNCETLRLYNLRPFSWKWHKNDAIDLHLVEEHSVRTLLKGIRVYRHDPFLFCNDMECKNILAKTSFPNFCCESNENILLSPHLSLSLLSIPMSFCRFSFYFDSLFFSLALFQSLSRQSGNFSSCFLLLSFGFHYFFFLLHFLSLISGEDKMGVFRAINANRRFLQGIKIFFYGPISCFNFSVNYYTMK